jgi:protein TonB
MLYPSHQNLNNFFMDQVSTVIKSVLKPIQSLYNQAFNANKYAAGIGLSLLITTGLFFIMVVLISLGDSGMKEDTSVKLADIVMPEREIDTFLSEVDKPEKPEEQPEDIAQPELDLQPLTGVDVSIPKPKANFSAGGSFFRDGEYIPLFKVQPIYPRRAQERGTEGFAIVSFTITESGTVENASALEGYCGDPEGPEEEMRPCSIFNSASSRAALKLKYKPKIVDGKATAVDGVLHRFTFIMADDE